MTTETELKTDEPATFDRTVAELKQGVADATRAQADVSEKAVKVAKDFAAFNKASLDAVAEAGKILLAGSLEQYARFTASAQATFAETMSACQALAAAKSAKEAIELLANLTHTTAAKAVSESARFAQARVALVEKASAPLTARAVQAAEAFAALKL